MAVVINKRREEGTEVNDFSALHWHVLCQGACAYMCVCLCVGIGGGDEYSVQQPLLPCDCMLVYMCV